MAIDAVIVKVIEDHDDLILVLGPRVYQTGGGKWGTSFAGQPEVRVKNYTYMPVVGQHIWGGADTARTEANIPKAKRQEYKRNFAGYLVEA